MHANITVTATYSLVTGLTVTPNPATLKVGDTQQFTSNVAGSGSFDHTVTWAVNGIGGGDATVGTITTAGLYGTPFPVPSSVTVKATSNLDSTKSGSAVVNIVATG
jgi:Bacterial Ig-like domain (group 2)